MRISKCSSVFLVVSSLHSSNFQISKIRIIFCQAFIISAKLKKNKINFVHASFRTFSSFIVYYFDYIYHFVIYISSKFVKSAIKINVSLPFCTHDLSNSKFQIRKIRKIRIIFPLPSPPPSFLVIFAKLKKRKEKRNLNGSTKRVFQMAGARLSLSRATLSKGWAETCEEKKKKEKEKSTLVASWKKSLLHARTKQPLDVETAAATLYFLLLPVSIGGILIRDSLFQWIEQKPGEKEREREETTRWKAESRSLAPVGFWTVSVGHFSARYFCSLARGRGSRHVTRLPALRTRHRFPTDFLATVQARLTRKLGIDTRGCPREHLPRERSNLSGELWFTASCRQRIKRLVYVQTLWGLHAPLQSRFARNLPSLLFFFLVVHSVHSWLFSFFFFFVFFSWRIWVCQKDWNRNIFLRDWVRKSSTFIIEHVYIGWAKNKSVIFSLYLPFILKVGQVHFWERWR